MKNRKLSFCLHLIAAFAFIGLPLVGGKVVAQTRQYPVSNPYRHEHRPDQKGPQTGGFNDGAKTNTKVARFLEIADAALQETPPRYADAESALRFAIINDPQDTQAYFRLGALYFTQQRFKDAIEIYKRAIQIQPDWPDAHFNLGLTYARLNMKKEALRELKTLHSMHSELADRLANALH